jgi:hypothetical protein
MHALTRPQQDSASGGFQMGGVKFALMNLCLASWSTFGMAAAPDESGGDSKAGNPGFTAFAVEYSKEGGRVQFFSHHALKFTKTLETGFPPHVLPAWSGNRFLIAWNTPGGEQAKIVEFDAEANRVVSEYVHPRGLAYLWKPGAMHNQRNPLVAGKGHMLWIETHKQVEVVDWKKKTLVREMERPSYTAYPFAVDGNCFLADFDFLTAVSLDSEPSDIALGLSRRKTMGWIHGAGNLICGIRSDGNLFLVEYLPKKREGIVRFGKNLVPQGYVVSRIFVIPESDSVMIALRPYDKLRIEKVMFISARDGRLLREGKLAEAADAVSYGDHHVWAVRREPPTVSMSCYDENLKLEREVKSARDPGLDSRSYLVDIVP